MSGTTYINAAETALENNLEDLFKFLSDLSDFGRQSIDFSMFSSEEHREDLMNLYSVSLAQDPLAAVARLYGASGQDAEQRESERRQFVEIIESNDQAYITDVLTQMKNTLNTLKTHDISLDTDRAREVYRDLMDFEELSAEEIQNSNLIDVRKKQPERDRVQTLLIDKLEPFQSVDAYKADDAAFFGGMTDDDFRNSRPNAIGTLFRPPTRVNLTRLYMMAEGGFSMQDLAKQSETMTDNKREWGAKFVDLVNSGDAERIGKSWAKMIQYLNAAKIPEIDFKNDESIANNFWQVKLLSSMATDVLQSVKHDVFTKPATEGFEDIRNSICANLTPEEQTEYDRVNIGLGALSECMRSKMQEITSEFYSGANNGRDRNFAMNFGCSDEQDLAANVLTTEHVAKNMNNTIMDAAGMSYSEMEGIHKPFTEAYADSRDKSNVNEITEGITQRYRDPEAAAPQAESIPLNKEELSFGDFLKESGTAKVEAAAKKVTEAAQQGTVQAGKGKGKGNNKGTK